MKTTTAMMATSPASIGLAFVAQGHTPVSYLVVVSESRDKALARDFIAFLATPAATGILRRCGFGKPE